MRSNSELSVVAIIELEGGAIQFDVAMVAKGLRIEPSFVHDGMRDGKITTLCERGFDEDEGHHRLTLFSENRRFRLVIGEGGNVVQSRRLTSVIGVFLPRRAGRAHEFESRVGFQTGGDTQYRRCS